MINPIYMFFSLLVAVYHDIQEFSYHYLFN